MVSLARIERYAYLRSDVGRALDYVPPIASAAWPSCPTRSLRGSQCWQPAVFGALPDLHAGGQLLPNRSRSVGSQMRYASMAAAAALLLTVSACSTLIIGPAASPRPLGTAGVGVIARVTEQNHSVTMKTGQKLLRELHAKPGMSDWSGVRSSNTSLLGPMTIDVMVPSGVTVAAFQAISRGQVMVTAVAGPACSPGQACPAYVVVYSLQVTIVSA